MFLNWMLILKSRELLLRESSGIDASTAMALVLLTSATAWVHRGWDNWPLVPLKHRTTTSLLYQPSAPKGSGRVSQGQRDCPTGHCAPCLLLPTEASSRSRGQQCWKKPEVTKTSYFRDLIFGSGQSRTNCILFSCYFHPIWCSQCCFYPVYLFLRQATSPIIHPNWLFETKQCMSMTLAREHPYKNHWFVSVTSSTMEEMKTSRPSYLL